MTAEELDAWLSVPAGSRRRTLVCGVLNITPDSFSDGGRFLDPPAAIARAKAMIAEGADWIDVGGESTRPGSEPVPAETQILRVLPAIAFIARAGCIASVDTTQAAVAEAALAAGACVVNDVTAGTDDAGMPSVMARSPAAVLMHMQGRPRTMQDSPSYDDVVGEVEAWLLGRASALEREAGLQRQRILIDPGIGFGKTLQHNLELLAALPRLASHGYPVLVGPSRKRFIGTITGEPDPAARVFGTAAAVAWCVAHGAAVVRVHDVREMRQVVQVAAALSEAAGRG